MPTNLDRYCDDDTGAVATAPCCLDADEAELATLVPPERVATPKQELRVVRCPKIIS
jgi:hypothetical protein